MKTTSKGINKLWYAVSCCTYEAFCVYFALAVELVGGLIDVIAAAAAADERSMDGLAILDIFYGKVLKNLKLAKEAAEANMKRTRTHSCDQNIQIFQPDCCSWTQLNSKL